MKILLFLWASGALGGPCRPSGPNTTGSSVNPSQSASYATDSHSLSASSGVAASHSDDDISTETLSTASSWLTGSAGSASSTLPGQPSHTDTISGPDDTNTVPGQPSGTDTETGATSVPSGGISGSGSTQPGNTETGSLTFTGSEPGPSGTETGSAATGTETGPATDTETGPAGTGTETVSTQPGNTETGSTETGPSGTESGPTGPGNTESASSGTDSGSTGTETGPAGTETGSSVSETGPSQSGNTETASSGTETGPTQPGATGTDTETGSAGTQTGPVGTETASSGTEGSVTQPGTETGTETGATESGSSHTESGSSGTETGPTQPGNTETSTESGSSGTESGPSGTETGPSATETGPSNTETASSSTETGPTQPGNTETSATETGPSGTESGSTQPGNTDTASTSGVPPQTSTTDGPTAPPTASTTSSSETYASTVTVPPENWAPTCASGHPEWTSNTWITTTSEGSTEQTIVPVIVGSKECDDDGSGLILFGFPPIVGTWFKFPGFPGFTFPCIPTFITPCSSPPKSEKDDDGDDDNKSSTAVTSCSETLTATDCLVACTTYTGVDDALITPECTTTCTKTHTGCSVTGVTSTTTEAEGCSVTGGGEGCEDCPQELTYTMNGSRGRDERDGDPPPIEKRWSQPSSNQVKGNKVGNCVISNGVTIEFPQYPEGNDVFLYEKAIRASSTSPLRLIDRWYYWNRKDEGGRCWLALEGAKSYTDYFGGKALPDQSDPSYREKAPSIDHVFEKSFLGDFWWSITPKNGQGKNIRGTKPANPVDEISCSDLIYYGSGGSKPFGSNQGGNALEDMTYITDVYKTYPGARKNPGGQDHQQVQPLDAHFLDDFIGVDAWTNEAKGFATTPRNIKWEVADAQTYFIDGSMSLKQIEDHVNLQIEVLDKLYIGVTLANKPTAREAMRRQNLRIYKAFLDMDKHARDCLQDPAVQDNKWSFAERYKTYMEERFDGNKDHSINPILLQAFAKMGPKIEQDLKDALTNIQNKINNDPANNEQRKKALLTTWTRKWNTLKRRYDSLLARFNSQRPAISVTWDWDIGNLPSKRDEGDDEGPSCQLPTTSSVATTLSTAVSTEAGPSSTGKPLDRCETVDDCGNTECDDGKTVTCGEIILFPGLKICQCQGDGDDSSSTAISAEPSSTGGPQSCLSSAECEMDCPEGEKPNCFKWLFDPNAHFGTCMCRKIPTTTEAPPTTTSTTPTPTPTTPTTTATVIAQPDPTPTAYCDIYAAGVMWYVEITRIDGWADDGGDSLKDEESGCGALTGWDWYGETKDWGVSVSFNLPFFIKEGCVERAIVSAGGPKLSCDSHPAWEVGDKKLGKGTEKMAIKAQMLAPDEPAFPEKYLEAKEESEEKYGTIALEETYTPMRWSETMQPTSTARR